MKRFDVHRVMNPVGGAKIFYLFVLKVFSGNEVRITKSGITE